MTVESTILNLFKTSIGVIVFIDFSEKVIPRIGEILNNKDGTRSWKITGMGRPLILEMLDEKIHSPYNSEAIFDIRIEPIGHSDSLQIGDVLIYTKRNL